MLHRRAMQVLYDWDEEDSLLSRQWNVGEEDAKVAGNRLGPQDASSGLTVTDVALVVASPSVMCARTFPCEAADLKVKREKLPPAHSYDLSSKVSLETLDFFKLEAISADDLHIS